MPIRFPALFVSHGAPSILFDECPTRSFLQQLAKTIGRPKGIICVSAHWVTAEPQVTLHPQPAMIYDFGGFQDELYRCTYSALGEQALANKVLVLLHEHGIVPGTVYETLRAICYVGNYSERDQIGF